MRDEGDLGRLPATTAVDRIDFLRSLARGHRVINLGFAERRGGGGSYTEGDPLWLHGRLAEVASGLIGIDLDEAGVERARAQGFEAHVADCADAAAVAALGLDPAEIVVAGEIIEHIERPGDFLDAIRPLVAPGGRLAVTTPNAASLMNPAAAVVGRELVNPDHVAFYSWFTLTNLLQRHGYRVERTLTYHRPVPPGPASRDPSMVAARALAAVQRAVARWKPFVDFGLIAVATPEG